MNSRLALKDNVSGSGRGHRHDPPPRCGDPTPDTLEGLLYALPEDRYVIGARRLAAALAEAAPVPRVSPWFGYSPLDPAHIASTDGIVFVKDARRS